MKTYQEFIVELNRYSQEKQDEILDKISKSGIDSLSKTEREFLDSFSSGDEDKTLDKIEKSFEVSPFTFQIKDTKEDLNQTYGNYIELSGSLFVDSLEFTGTFFINKDDGVVNHFEFRNIDNPDVSLYDVILDDEIETIFYEFIDHIVSNVI